MKSIINGFEFIQTDHAQERLKQRGINNECLFDTILNGAYYRRNGYLFFTQKKEKSTKPPPEKKKI